MKTIIAFIPVLHAGYLAFLRKHAEKAERLLILGKKFVKNSYLRKEIRMLPDDDLVLFLETLNLFRRIDVCTPDLLKELSAEKAAVVMPDEDISREVAKKYLSDCVVIFDSVFLRWHRDNYRTEKAVRSDEIVRLAELDRSHVLWRASQLANEVKGKSSDWWRRIGAVLIRNDEIIFAFPNRHLPSDHTPYVHGDPRNCAHQGVDVELASSLHAERLVIAEAARWGIRTDGCDLLVTTFPCRTCAALILKAGIQNLYFFEGYSVLDAESILRPKVKIIKLEY